MRPGAFSSGFLARGDDGFEEWVVNSPNPAGVGRGDWSSFLFAFVLYDRNDHGGLSHISQHGRSYILDICSVWSVSHFFQNSRVGVVRFNTKRSCYEEGERANSRASVQGSITWEG